MVLDGTNKADGRAKKVLGWDVSNGVSPTGTVGLGKVSTADLEWFLMRPTRLTEAGFTDLRHDD